MYSPHSLAFSNIEVVFDEEKDYFPGEKKLDSVTKLINCEKSVSKFLEPNVACQNLYEYFYRNTKCDEKCEKSIKGCLEYINTEKSVVQGDQCLILYKVGKNW